ncbi:DUF559 domain-containing protein [Methylobacterium sp. NEAU 140]|uniref:endonuclease domain-containing protein n=1 Tax=Methylobacterium sp. NEAU 140 TaxID=3064945 RepID=UPI0027361EC4|nr:DUF559 domain-containing protein [Methylobacterium sp. NEAU 140]MDP4025212.1 DUF559 domain-containing protein [Methylobacterium sp. NEAU 140]
MAIADEPVPHRQGTSSLPTLSPAELRGRILRLEAGERLVVAGIGSEGLGRILAASDEAVCSRLVLANDGLRTTEAVLDRLLDDLAAVALARWPCWHGREGGVGSRSHGPWLKAAAKHAAAGRRPRFRRAAKSLEFAQLLLAIDPAGLVLVADVDPASPVRAAPAVEALEWCARHGAAVVALFSAVPPHVPPYDRVLYGAHEVLRDPAPVEVRFIDPRSRAHHASAVERRVEAALASDPELGPLFSCNARVPLGPSRTAPRVDLLWREGRVVVELDGPEHRRDPTFSADRHRDYELLVAGYLVLRITNEQAETDLQRAVEKIRDVVRLRRPMGVTIR